MQIRVLDHIVIGENTYFSFAADGLIEEYELDFLNMKLRGTSEAKRRIYQAKAQKNKSPLTGPGGAI
ncbi:JAB domain-containing protein [Chloroflexota bacterium]